MTPRDLELYPTQELIEELMRRTSFLGVVVHAQEEARTPWQTGERSFRVHFNGNLDRDEACRLLSIVGEEMEGRWAS